jgi:signal peptidase II
LVPSEVHELLPFINLRLGFKRGISFCFLHADETSSVPLLMRATALISTGIAVWSSMTQTWQEGAALALILAGALGNLIDRMRDGMVTNFIDLHALSYHWRLSTWLTLASP